MRTLRFCKGFQKRKERRWASFWRGQARSLRRQLEVPLPPEIIAASGIITGDVDSKNEILEHVQRKHR